MFIVISYQVRVARVFVDHRVPNTVQVCDSCVAYFWNVLKIATSITLWIIVVNLRHSVQGLVDIANVMNN